jgi:hypothetical protein
VAVVKCMSLSEVKKRSIAGVNRPSQDDGVGIVCVRFVVVLNDTQQVHPSVGSSQGVPHFLQSAVTHCSIVLWTSTYTSDIFLNPCSNFFS